MSAARRGGSGWLEASGDAGRNCRTCHRGRRLRHLWYQRRQQQDRRRLQRRGRQRGHQRLILRRDAGIPPPGLRGHESADSPPGTTTMAIPVAHLHRIGVAVGPPCIDTNQLGIDDTPAAVQVAQIDEVSPAIAIAALPRGDFYLRAGQRFPASSRRPPGFTGSSPTRPAVAGMTMHAAIGGTGDPPRCCHVRVPASAEAGDVSRMRQDVSDSLRTCRHTRTSPSAHRDQ